ncbi:uncharacterized protein ATNIH1004_010081 [Aspergillus tanneri]|uniref:Uncharacterized protein n=1 Tax=Aspergillus tanneri TaxID=1220188 RepID=A0A5M9MDF3_9EURO|nr:uncharacterized protein ATNIH1004_010081 [Aspergillus tanneri]KAA8643314.1 hypothetical protein ATNIH1004_010081 [Aspergillus tanneri]
MFDATFTPRGAHVSTLRANGQIRYWITVIFGHLKALGGTGEAADLIKETLVNVLDVKVASSACPEPVNCGCQARQFQEISEHWNFQREL